VAQPTNHHDSFRPVVAAKQLCRTMRHDGGGEGGLLLDICLSAHSAGVMGEIKMM